jgi:hypothetical protein
LAIIVVNRRDLIVVPSSHTSSVYSRPWALVWEYLSSRQQGIRQSAEAVLGWAYFSAVYLFAVSGIKGTLSKEQIDLQCSGFTGGEGNQMGLCSLTLTGPPTLLCHLLPLLL